MQLKRALYFMAVLSSAILLTSCASSPKTFTIKGEGDPILNRDINGSSLSVVVRIYQLRDYREFSKLTFDMLASGRSESELLGPALLEKSDVVVVPGGEYVSSEKLLDETRFVGIVAFFRTPDPYYWRLLVDAEAVKKQSGIIDRASALTFRVKDCYLSLAGTKPMPLPDQPQNGHPECPLSGAMANRPAMRNSVPEPDPGPAKTANPSRKPIHPR